MNRRLGDWGLAKPPPFFEEWERCFFLAVARSLRQPASAACNSVSSASPAATISATIA